MSVAGFREGTPAYDILQYLLHHGSATVKELEEVLGVSTTSVREQLTHLTNQALITPQKVRQGPGRPLNRYVLTSKAQSLFPKGYDVLINVLLEEILRTHGAEHLAELLTRVGIRLAEQYDLPAAHDALRERLMALAYAMNEQGMPIKIAQTEDGWVVSEYGCPYFEVAQEHSHVCTMERRMLEAAIGLEVELSQRMVEGHHGCHFVVKPRELSPEPGSSSDLA